MSSFPLTINGQTWRHGEKDPQEENKSHNCEFLPRLQPFSSFLCRLSAILLSHHQTECLFFSYLGTGGEQTEVEVSKQEAKLLIEDFDPSKEYNFKIIAVSGNQQSKPLQAKHEGKRR